MPMESTLSSPQEGFLSLVRAALDCGASDIFLIAGQPPTCKTGHELRLLSEQRIMPDMSEALITQAYSLANRTLDKLRRGGDDDFAVSVPQLTRMRVNAYRQRGSLAAVVRLVPFGIPDYQKIGIPETVMSAAGVKQGLVLVSGTAGSGKSTTQACILDRINHTRSGHIVTLEDPIEYLYRNDRCIISQREIHVDAQDYLTALRASLRQAPDVILLGEMRDYETISTAMTAAETGHLVLSTLHTRGAANTIDRIIDIFPPDQQQQIRVQLAALLQKVVSQQLITDRDGAIIPVFEVMNVNTAIRNLIREAKLNQITNVIATSAAEGMVSMDNALADLCAQGRITRDAAINAAINPDSLEKRLK